MGEAQVGPRGRSPARARDRGVTLIIGGERSRQPTEKGEEEGRNQSGEWPV